MNNTDGSAGHVSVIIPTKNSSNTIHKCLKSINDQTYKNIEIVVVDAHSSDNTREISRQLGAHVIVQEGERTKAKNSGAGEAKGEFLFFVDSDMILEPSVIGECVKAFADNTIAGVIIPERSIGSGFWVKVRDLERSLYVGSKIESARFFKKRYVMQVGGFDEEVVFFEESTLPQKIEKKLGMNVSVRVTSAILHDEEGFNLRKWLNKKKYYYNSAKQYSKKYSYGRSQISLSYRISTFTSHGKWKILIRHPVLSIGLIVLKMLEFVSSR